MPRVAATPKTAARRPRSPRWRRRKDARPEEIVAAALDVFVERGFAATKLADVARRAGVTKGTIYLYFENKEALFKAVVRETIVPVIAKGEALVQALTAPHGERARARHQGRRIPARRPARGLEARHGAPDARRDRAPGLRVVHARRLRRP